MTIRPSRPAPPRDRTRAGDRLRRRAVVACAAVGLVLTFGLLTTGSPAVAVLDRHRGAPTWTVPVPVSPKEWSSSPEPAVVVDDAGNTTVAWIGTDNDFLDERGLAVRRKPAGAEWEPVQVVDESGGVNADAAADPAGDVTIVYGRTPGRRAYHRSLPYAVTSDPTGVFAEPVRLSGVGRVWDEMRVVVSPDGTTTAAWISLDPDQARGRRVMVAQRPPGADWAPATYLHTAGSRAFDLALDAGPDNTVGVVWTDRRLGAGWHAVRVHERTATGEGWSPTQTLSEPGALRAHDLELSMGRNGTAIASWLHRIGRYADGELRVTAERRSNGSWTEPRPLPVPVGYSPAQFARAGDAVLMLSTDAGASSTSVLVARIRRPNGTWGRPVTLSRRGGVVGKVVAAGDDAGRIRVVWEFQERASPNGDRYEVVTRSRTPSGHWSARSVVSTRRMTVGTTSVDLGPVGTAGAVWKQRDGGVTAFGRVMYAGLE